MIEQMKKVSIVILNKEKEDALKALRKIGLVHLQNIEGSSEKLNAFKEYTNNALLSESILGEIKLSKKIALYNMAKHIYYLHNILYHMMWIIRIEHQEVNII